MKAARYLGRGRLEPADTAVPSLQEGEALLRVQACGFCGSDLGILSGKHPRARAPLTIGHEFSARIVDLRPSAAEGENGRFGQGDAVTAYPLISCGNCFVCRTGNAHVCRKLGLYGIDADGGMAEFVKLPISNLVLLPIDMDPFVGALIEPLAVAIHGVNRGSSEPAHSAVVLGAGPIGLLTALVARAQGIAQVVIADVRQSRVQFARDLNLTACLAGDELRDMVAHVTDGEGADVVFECAGAAASAVAMTALARSRGTVVNLGVFKEPASVDLQTVNFRELTLVGSRVYTRQDFTDAIAMAAKLPLKQMITHVFPIAEVREAFELFRAGEDVCKVLIRP